MVAMHLGPFEELAGIAAGHEVLLADEEVGFAVALALARGAGGEGDRVPDVAARIEQGANQRGFAGAGRRGNDQDGASGMGHG